jgi:prevent-host-death family protein
MDTFEEIGAGEFKAKCLQLMDLVQKTKIPIVITKRGKPVAKLMPFESEPEEFFGCLKGSVHISADIINPFDVQWDADE